MLKLAHAAHAEIRAHAETAYPDECCGILLGVIESERRIVRSVLPCANISPSPQKRFAIDSRDLIRAQRDARKTGLQIVGFYHSHPNGAAQWSQTDIEEALWPHCSYLIVPVENGRATEMKSFALVGTDEQRHFRREEIMISRG